jgi:hypothetical protein
MKEEVRSLEEISKNLLGNLKIEIPFKIVRIFLQGYLYAVTQHLLGFFIFKFPERFLEISWRDLTISTISMTIII